MIEVRIRLKHEEEETEKKKDMNDFTFKTIIGNGINMILKALGIIFALGCVYYISSGGGK